MVSDRAGDVREREKLYEDMERAIDAGDYAEVRRLAKAILGSDAALDTPQEPPEPVAWLVMSERGPEHACLSKRDAESDAQHAAQHYNAEVWVVPLYRHPPTDTGEE